MQGQFFAWEPPGVGICVRMRFSAIDRMNRAVQHAFESLPERGLEIGGVLLGSTSQTPAGLCVTVDDFEQVACEHRRGASYVMSRKDKEKLERRLRKHRGGWQVVGYFRSHTRPGLYLDEDDYGLACRYFASPEQVILLARPAAGQDPTAGFFYWEDGEIHRASSRLSFPLNSQRLGAPAPAPAQAAISPEPVPKPEQVRLSRPPRRFEIPFPPSWMVAAGMAGIALASGLLVSARRETAIRPSLGLRAERELGQLRLEWDRAAVKGARGGTLFVGEPGNQRRLALTPDQLAEGTFVYQSNAPDLAVRLDVDAPAKPSESLRVISGLAQEPAQSARLDSDLSPHPVRQTLTQEIAGAAKATGSVGHSFAHVATQAVPSRPSAVQGRTEDQTADRAVARPVAPSPPPAPQPSRRREETVLQAKAASPAGGLTRSRPARREPVEISIEPAPPTPVQKVVGKIPVLRRVEHSQSENFVPARAVSRRVPVVPPGAREAPVDLRLYVDREGRVTGKTIVRSEDRALADVALNSVDTWRFQPATVNDKPTPSEVLVHFRFPRTGDSGKP